VSVPRLLVVLDAVLPSYQNREPDDGAGSAVRRAAVDIVSRRHGPVRTGSHAYTQLLAVSEAADLLNIGELGTALDGYAEAADRVAESDAAMVAALIARRPRTDAVETLRGLERVVAAVVLGVAAETALCALAREDRLTRHFITGDDRPGTGS
jgi:ribosomal protein L18